MTGEIFCIEGDRFDAAVFLEFLKAILKKYPNGKTAIVLDNSRIHRAKILVEFLEENKERLELVFLPPYSPELNLIEGLWKWLKSDIMINVFYETSEEIKTSIRNFIITISQNPSEIITRLCQF